MTQMQVRRIYRRGAQAALIFLLLVIGTLTAPYTALVLQHIGLTKPADLLYAFTVRGLDVVDMRLAPEWAFTELANLRPEAPRLVQIGNNAKRHRLSVALALYERAIPQGSPPQRKQWLEEYAVLLAPADAQEAAKAYLAAANIALSAADFEAAHADIEASLAIHDDDDVRWKEALLLINRGDPRANDVLRHMINAHQHEPAASHALGLLLWRSSGDPDETYALLRAAAGDQTYTSDFEAFKTARAAAAELAALRANEAAQMEAAQAERNTALAEHEALHERLKRFSCDVRQWSDWESHSDEELTRACSQTRLTVAITKLAMLAIPLLIPELLVVRMGAAELGALETRALGAEAVAAARAGATAERSYAVPVARELRRGGSRSVDMSIEARKSYSWKMSFGAELTARLDAEEAAIVNEIELVLEFRRKRITTYFRPREERAQSTRVAQEVRRDQQIAQIRETEHVVRVKLGRIPLDDPQHQQCPTNDSTSPACRQTRPG
jgi:hypothetical protein